jgi:2-hydroxy-3-keto-5-methylthiopentenyl-1-phosphate phosphatase
VTLDEAYEDYVAFCQERDLTILPKEQFAEIYEQLKKIEP